jgi:uncharacterized protein (TIGR03437 family)
VKTVERSTLEKTMFRLTTVMVALLVCFASAQAQSTTLSANPSQLTFNTQNGVVTQAQSVLVTSAPSSVSITVSAFSANNWLVVTPSTGNTPLSLTVSIGASAPTSGTDTGFISIASPGASLTIPVVLNANAQGGASPLVVNPNSLSFTIPANNTSPVTQQVSVTSNSSSVTSITASAFTNGTGSWLSVTPAPGSGALPNSLQVTVNPNALPAGNGPFSGAISINAPGTAGISLPVLVTVGGTPSLKVTPSQVSFAFQLGTAGPVPQPLAITTSTGANLTFSATAKTASCGNNWLVISQQSGVTPATISVQVNTSGLVAGNCTGEVDISAPGASNPSVVVPVTLLASTNPLLLVPAIGPSFTFQFGSNTTPAAQNVQITSSSTVLNYTATVTPSNGGPNFLTLTPAAGTTPQALSIAVNPTVLATLANGTYSDTVTVTSNNAGNSPQSFPVTLTISANALLTASVPSLSFFDQVGQASPPSQTFTVGSTGGPLNFQVSTTTSTCPGFLSSSANGGTTGSTFGNQNLVVVSVNPAAITPQLCSGNVTISVPGSTTPPLVIPVQMFFSTGALLVLSPNAINVTTLIGAASTTQQVSVTTTDNTVLPFNATAATNPPGLTWLSVAPNSGNTPNNLLVTINPLNLAVGTYTGSITVTSGSATPETIPVTLVIVASNVSGNPTSLAFAQSLGSAQPASQSVTISGIPAGTTIGQVTTELTASNVNWLSASVSNSNTVAVTVNGSQLGVGTYSGVVTVIVPGAGNSPLNIPVTFTISTAASLAVSPAAVTFSYQAGSTTFPAAQSVQVNSTGGSVPFTAAFAPINLNVPNLITVTPSTGTTPATISLALNQAALSGLVPGTYTGTVTVSSASIPTGSQTINVTVSVTGAPPPIVISLDNAATLQTGAVSPGEVVTFFGNGMGPVAGLSYTLVNGKLPTTIAGVTVSFNSVPAPLLFVSSTQINAIVPYEIGGQVSANVVVTYTNSSSSAFQAQITDTAPGIFSLSQGGSGQGAILNQNYSVNGSGIPAAKGSIVQIFGTGEGQLVPGVASGSFTPIAGPYPAPVGKVTLTIGGIPAQVTYAGEAPGLVSGVIQVNAVVPAGVGSGAQQVVLTIGNHTNTQQTITVFVQ